MTAGALEARDVGLLRDMIRIRRFEEKAAELYGAGKIRGFLHLYVGEEAIAAGVVPELGDDDALVSTYREHGHALVRGLSARSIMAEMFGKVEGCAHGRGGSMHLFDVRKRFYGGNAIVGGGLPLAVGLALAEKMLGRPGVAACFFGDGAAAEGTFHESLNLAALWKLPVLFLCENNQYAMGTALRYSHSQTDLRAKASAYVLDAEAVDGMDVFAVRGAVRLALARVRAGEGPSFLELRTYRFRAHSMFDADLYRDKAEVEAWKKRDPIALATARLREAGVVTPADVARLEAEAAAEVDDAAAFADAGTWEPISDLAKDVYLDRQRHGHDG